MPNELETLREALEAKCALYAASLKQADARVAELERIAGSDPTTATRDDLRRWTAQQHDEIRELRAALAETRRRALEEAIAAIDEAFGRDEDVAAQDVLRSLIHTPEEKPG